MLTCSLGQQPCGLPAVTVLIWQEGGNGLAYAFPRCEIHKSQLAYTLETGGPAGVRTLQLPVPLAVPVT